MVLVLAVVVVVIIPLWGYVGVPLLLPAPSSLTSPDRLTIVRFLVGTSGGGNSLVTSVRVLVVSFVELRWACPADGGIDADALRVVGVARNQPLQEMESCKQIAQHTALLARGARSRSQNVQPQKLDSMSTRLWQDGLPRCAAGGLQDLEANLHCTCEGISPDGGQCLC